jgi:hypothetical protein
MNDVPVRYRFDPETIEIISKTDDIDVHKQKTKKKA